VAGLDVHRDTVSACARTLGWRRGSHVEKARFATTTAWLAELSARLVEHEVTVVGMEATGVYWKPLYYALEGRLEVWCRVRSAGRNARLRASRRLLEDHTHPVSSQHAKILSRKLPIPGRSRTVPHPTGSGTWAYKPVGEVAGDAVREVGVISGTHEPGKSKSPGTVPVVGRRAATQKAPIRGKGSRREMAIRAGERASRRSSGLMVAAAMTEALALRTPGTRRRGAR
jgi:hypothetical protein